MGTTPGSSIVFNGLVLNYGENETVEGTANNTTVNYGGTLEVYMGTASNTTINGGIMEVIQGGRAFDTTVNGIDPELISGVMIEGGVLDLECFGDGSSTATRTTVNSGGSVRVGRAGILNSATIKAGAAVYLWLEGKATGSITIENGAIFSADSGATIDFNLSGLSPENDALVNDLSLVQGAPGFTLTVGGTLNEGTYKLAGGAAGFDKTISVVNTSGRALGTLSIATGTQSIAGRDYTLSLAGDALCVTLGPQPGGIDLTNDLTKTYDITAGTAINGVHIGNGGKLNVYGATSDTTISAGGSLTVFEGGLAHNAMIDEKGRLYVSDGGSATQTTVSRYGYMHVSSGGSASGTTLIGIYGSMYILAGGSAADTTINWGGGVTVSKDASADGVTVNALGRLHVSAGGTATNVRENGGNVLVGDGATVTFIPNAFSGIAVEQAYCTVHSGTTGTDITLNQFGNLRVYAGGIANSVTVNTSGCMYVSSGGTATQIVENDGWGEVSSGGTADIVTVNRCGRMYVSAGGTATQIVENGGWVEADPDATVTFVPNVLSGIVFDKGLDGATIHSGTTGIDLTFNNGNGLALFSGGFVKNVTVGYYIGLDVYSGAKVTGKMTFENGATVTAETGAVFDFDLTQTTPGADALLNNLSVVKGDPTFTLTVDNQQALGTYKLAGGAEGFDKTITVRSIYGDTAGTISVADGTIKLGEAYITLALDGSDLTFTISETGNGIIPGNEPANNWLFKKEKKKYVWNEADNINTFYVNDVVATAAGETRMIYLDPNGPVESEDGKYFNSLSRTKTEAGETVEDAADYAKIELAYGAALQFSVDSTVGGTFYVYEKTKDKNGNDIATQRQKITVKANKASPAKLTTIYLAAGEYFVGMDGSLPSKRSKPEFSAYYNVNLTGTKYFENADGGWNDSVYAIDEDTGKEDKTKFNALLEAGALVLERGVTDIKLDDGAAGTDDWVGFTDATDNRMLKLSSKTNLTLSLKVTGTETGKGKAKLTIWKVSTGKGGKITLSSKGSIEVKQGATGFIKSKVLAVGTYFVSVTSSSASKGSDVSYSVKVDEKTVFFDSADGDTVNKYVYDSKKNLNPEIDKFRTNSITVSGKPEYVFLDSNEIKLADYSSFVGYNDKADYAKLSVTAKSDVTFTIDTTGSGTFAVYRDNKDKSKLELVKKVEIKADAKTGEGHETLDVAGLSADEDYYISMTAKSTKTNSSGSVFYNVTANATLSASESSALAMPETDSLGISDALSFGGYDVDVLADASAASLAELDDKSAWQSLLA